MCAPTPTWAAVETHDYFGVRLPAAWAEIICTFVSTVDKCGANTLSFSYKFSHYEQQDALYVRRKRRPESSPHDTTRAGGMSLSNRLQVLQSVSPPNACNWRIPGAIF